MRVNNQTTDPVDYEQTGGDPPDPENAIVSQSGQLAAGTETGSFVPAGTSPWEVGFRSVGIKPEKSAKSPEITDPNATVTLNDNWTVTVT
jgi:hypothetical protein